LKRASAIEALMSNVSAVTRVLSGVLRPLPIALAALLTLTIVVSTPASRPAAIKAAPVATTGAWTVYHHDNAHTGYDSSLPPVNSVSTGWTSAAADGQIYASPLIFNGVVYTATLNNTVYAINQATGATVWSKNLGTPQSGGWVCGNFSVQGILGTPVIDTAANRIYAVALITGTTPTYHLFGLDLANSGNVVLDTVVSPAGFDWKIQQQRGALALANGFVYVPIGGRAGDCFDNGTPYYGWVVGAPTSGVGAPNVFKTPSGAESVWAAGGVVVDDTSHNVFFATGNAIPCAGSTMSDAIVRVSPTLTLPTFFEPNDWQANWCGPDSDLGSASPVLISPTLMFTAGKRGGGFLLDPTNLGGVNGQLYPPRTPYAQAEVCLGTHADATFGSFAYAAPFVYVECESASGGSGLVALNVNTSAPSFTPCPAACTAPDWRAGPTTLFGPPIVAAGAVWVASSSGLTAFNATTGALIYQSSSFGVNRFVTPAEAGGAVFVPAGNVIRSFNMNFGCMGTPLSTTYLNWYDKASPGMVADNIHILNSGATASSGCVTVTGYPGVAWSAGAGQETYVNLPAGTIGGPVLITVTSGPAVKASQRIQYNQSFNEVWAAGATQAATTSYLNWYDKASPGMLNDNIHLLNPGATSATVTVTLPGATQQMATVAAGGETYVNFPQGTIGGPVTVSSSQPVLASQRVQYNQTFNEVWAAGAGQAAATSFLNWYDKASPGMNNDNIHLLNPGATSATVTVTLPGATPQTVSVAAGAEAYVNFPGMIGGPVLVSSTSPVLSSQRVQFNQSFNEVWSASAAQAATTSYFNWYDKASAGMFNDNIHLLNPGTTSATVTVSLPGATSQVVTVAAGAEMYVNFPGSLGGPVTVSSPQAVLASQRVQFYQTFNEIWSS
jgi:PQQ-like domain